MSWLYTIDETNKPISINLDNVIVVEGTQRPSPVNTNSLMAMTKITFIGGSSIVSLVSYTDFKSKLQGNK